MRAFSRSRTDLLLVVPIFLTTIFNADHKSFSTRGFFEVPNEYWDLFPPDHGPVARRPPRPVESLVHGVSQFSIILTRFE